MVEWALDVGSEFFYYNVRRTDRETERAILATRRGDASGGTVEKATTNRKCC